MLALLLACAHTLPPALEAPPPSAPSPGPVRVVQPVVADVVLFGDELRPVAEAAAAFLTDQGWQALPFDEPDRLLALAAEGRRASTGELCSVPYVGDYLLAHSLPDHAEAAVRVYCDGDCTLTLGVTAPPSATGRGVEWARWQAPLPGPPTVQAMVEAMASLSVPPPPEGIGGLLGGSGTRVESQGVLVRDVEPSGPWGELSARAALQAVDLDACWVDWRRDFWSNPVLLELSAQGQVSRCASRYPHRLPEPAHVCACEVLEQASFPPGEPGRRVRFEAHPYQPTPVEPGGRRVAVSAEQVSARVPGFAWAATGLPEHRMAACLASAAGAASFEGSIAYQLDPSGAPLSWQVDWPGWVDAQALACLEPLLAQARFGCSQTGEPGEAVVVLRVSLWE